MKSINISNVNLEIFKGESFCRAACWFDIVTLAATEPESVFWNGKMLTLQSGEFLTSVRQLADRWSMSADHARSRLKEFVKCNLIKVARSASGIVITVLALCQKSSVNIRDSDTTDSHNCAKSDPLGSNLDEWFDELSIDLALRQELLEKHGITNWTNFRTEFGQYLLAHLDVAQKWLTASDDMRRKLLLDNIEQMVSDKSRCQPKEQTRQIMTSGKRYVRQFGSYVSLPDDLPDLPSCEHFLDTTFNKWRLNPPRPRSDG
jgi:hypothetical protein